MARKTIGIFFEIDQDNYIKFYNAWTSMLELDPYPDQVLIGFNGYNSQEYDRCFDIQEFRNFDIIKVKNKRSSLYPAALALSSVDYLLKCPFNCVFTDSKILKKVLDAHKSKNVIVNVDGISSSESSDKLNFPTDIIALNNLVRKS